MSKVPVGRTRLDEISKRRETAKQDNIHFTQVKGDNYFGWYQVAGSRGSVYEVEVALEERRRATCTCHDFSKNGLGTCKHIETVRLWLATTPEATNWCDPLSICQDDISQLDAVVFDLETQRLFQDVGGYRNTSKLGLSVGVVGDLRNGSFTTYWEKDANALVDRLCRADLVIGYNLLNFDYPVLEAYGGHRLYSIPTLDMLLLVAEELGFRVGLDALAQGTLGTGKTADGLQAVQWYRTGELELLAQYCQSDVEVTASLFQYGREKGNVQFLGRDGHMHQVIAKWAKPATEIAG